MPTSLTYLLLDKDQTLGDFPTPGFYPGVAEFLQQQHESGRNLAIVTTDKTNETKRDLLSIDHLIHAYLCREHFRIQDKYATIIKDFYLDHNGQIQELK